MASPFRTLTPFLKRYRWWYAAGLICLLLTNAAQLLVPQFVRLSLDVPAEAAQWALGLGLTALVIGLTRFGWRWFLIGAARRIEAGLRQKVFHHTLSLGEGFFQKQSTGDLMARFTNDLDAVRMAAGMSFVAATDGLFLTGSIVVILFATNPVLALWTIAPLPVITLLILALGGRVGKLFQRVQEGFAALSGHAQEAFTGVRVLQAFGLEERQGQRFSELNREYLRRNLDLVKLWGLFFPLLGFLAGLTTLVLLGIGGLQVLEGRLSAGELAAYLSYLGMLIWPLMGAGMVVNLLQRGRASLIRLNEILDTAPDIVSAPGAPRPPRAASLEIRNLSYRYPGTETAVLRDLSFTLEPGRFVGILGPTGSGKTTLLKLLPRLLDPPAGSVRLGGQPIEAYELESLRRCFSYVPQQTFLFSDTVLNNLRFGHPDASEAEARAMADLASFSRDVDTFSQGWDTLVGERGVTLSGGQKQRLALARALLVPAPFLLLDDALSAVDAATEDRILNHLFEQRTERALLVVSHRAKTLTRCDTVLVLEGGRLTQQGRPSELLAADGFFSRIARLQDLEGAQHG